MNKLPVPMSIPEDLAFLKTTPMHSEAVLKVRYSYSGTWLASGSIDTTILLTRTPASKANFEMHSFTGHNGTVNSLCFSANDEFLLSASADKSMILWNASAQKRGEKVLQMTKLLKSDRAAMTAQEQKANKPFAHEITRASFYALDRFILCSMGSGLLFYKYELTDPQCKDDVKRLQSKGLYKLVQSFDHPDAKNIPCFATHNRVLTQLVLVAGSNKELLVYDANYNRVVSAFDDTHFKSVHSLRFYEGSFGESSACFNVFWTASTDGYLKVWDLRRCRPVMEFSNHKNRNFSVGADISHCFRYIISGSEDRAAYVYDLRRAAFLEKTKNAEHGDAVADVCFNPGFFEWATGSFDGNVRFIRHS